MKRLCGWMSVGLLGAAAMWSAATMPSASLSLPAAEDGRPRRPVVRGAYHMHSTESDGTASVAVIADAARRAGLDFIIVTDHADGRRPIRAPRYYSGVLCLEAMEISTDDGHYVALGLDAPPYRLGGDGRSVAEDVQRMGGFGIVAHPDSSKHDLQWKDWDMPIGGIEWFNADSQWRDEHPLALALALTHYLFRKPESVASIFDRPVDALAAWDRLTAEGHVVGLAAADAHARLGFGGSSDPYEGGIYVPLPSYEAMFRTFSLQVELDDAFDGRAPGDARRLLDAIRAGRVTTSFEAFAAPADVVFEGEAAGEWAGPGGDLPRVTPITFRLRSNAPDGATSVLLRNGEVVHESPSADVEWQTRLAGAFRAEIRLPNAPGHPGVPWVVTNPIYVGVPAAPPGPPTDGPASSSTPLPGSGWTVERDAASQGTIQVASQADAPLDASLTFSLASEPATSPYVAAVTHDIGALLDAERLSFRASASRPLRLSVQLRAGGVGGDRRWRRSVYLDGTIRDITVAFNDLRGIGSARGMALPVGDVTSLLFVVDTVNASPGDAGTITLTDVMAERR